MEAPTGPIPGPDLLRTTRSRCARTILTPFLLTGLFAALALRGEVLIGVVALLPLGAATYGSTSHDLVHASLGLPRRWNAVLLSLIEALSLRSGTAYRRAHLHHHAVFPSAEDVEAHLASRSRRAALLDGPVAMLRVWRWAWRRHPRDRPVLALEAAAILGLVCLAIAVFPSTGIPLLYCTIVILQSWTFPFITVWIPHDAAADSPLRRTRLFRGIVLDMLFAGHLYHLEHHLHPAVPHHHWRELARRLDGSFAGSGLEPVRRLRELVP